MTGRFRNLALSGCLLGVATALSGCNDETATVLEPLNRTSYNFLLLKEGANIPRGEVITTRQPVALGGANTFTLNLRGLEKLTGNGGYQVWVGTVAALPSPSTDFAITAGTLRKLTTSDLLVVRVDTSISPAGDFVPKTDTLLRRLATGQSAFNEGGPGVTVTMRATTASLGVNPSTLNLMIVTLVTDTAASPVPDVEGNPAKLWARYRTPGNPPAATPANPDSVVTTTVFFGNFNATPAKQYTFVPSGRGRGSLLSDRNVLIIDDSILARPPRGYYYETFLVMRADSTSFFARDTISIGPQTAPYPRRSISLYGADSALVDQVVQTTPPIIYAAANRVQGDSVPRLSTTANRFRGLGNVWITLEAKLGTPAMSPAVILNGVAPPPIRFRD